MLDTIKNKLTRVFLGQLVKDWGMVSQQSGTLFNEKLSLALYEKDHQSNLCLTYEYGAANKQLLSFPVADLRQFVATLERGLDELDWIARTPQPHVPTVGSNRLPLFQRLVAKVVHGVKASRLLIESSSGDSGSAGIQIYGYVTRNDDTKVLLRWQSSDDSSQIVSSEGIRAMVRALSDYLRAA